MKKKIAVVLVLLMSIGLTACNTMEGLGRDIERGGEKLQGSSRDAKESM